ncbi:unnamed protein product, partial [Candidula unifasciata]
MITMALSAIARLTGLDGVSRHRTEINQGRHLLHLDPAESGGPPVVSAKTDQAINISHPFSNSGDVVSGKLPHAGFPTENNLAETLSSLLQNLSKTFQAFQSSHDTNASVSFSDFFHATFPVSNSTQAAFREYNLTPPAPVQTLQGLSETTQSGLDTFITSTAWGHLNDCSTRNSTHEIIGLDKTTAEIVIIAIVVSLLSVLTAGGNLMVIVAFKLDKNLQTVSNYFLLSLAVADLTIGIVSMPLYTVYLLMGYWPLKALMCDIWLSLDYTMSNASVANLIIISFDRYLSVTRPLTYRAKRTPKRAGTMIGCAWVISSVIWTPWIFAWPYIEGQRNVPETDCYIQFLKTNQYITIITAMFAFFIPVIIMSVLYFKIYMETQKRQKDLPKLQGMHKSKKIKDPQMRHHSSRKYVTSSDEEANSCVSERGNNMMVHSNGTNSTEPSSVKSKLLGCLKIDRDSDYLEDSSSSEPPGSPTTSNTHSHATIPVLCTSEINNGNSLPRQDSENSSTSVHESSSPNPRCVRINFSTSLIPLLPIESPISPCSVYRDQGNTTTFTSEHLVPSLYNSSYRGHSGMLTTSFSDPVAEAIQEDANSLDSSQSLHENNYTNQHDSEDEDDEDDEAAMYRVLILLPSDAEDSNHKVTSRAEPEDMDRFSELNPALVQRIESDTDEDDVASRCLPERISHPPPIRPRTGTPALARRAHSHDSNKVAMQAKIAAKAATRVRKAEQQSQAKIQSRRQERRQDQKAAKTLTAILLAFIVTWTPYNIFTVAEVFCEGCVDKTLYSI